MPRLWLLARLERDRQSCDVIAFLISSKVLCQRWWESLTTHLLLRDSPTFVLQSWPSSMLLCISSREDPAMKVGNTIPWAFIPNWIKIRKLAEHRQSVRLAQLHEQRVWWDRHLLFLLSSFSTNHDSSTLKLWAKLSLPSISCCHLAFCHRNEKVTKPLYRELRNTGTFYNYFRSSSEYVPCGKGHFFF